eukprot:scaffold76157_cov21-Tisochrysis_lutea.AAC.3
MGCHAQRAARYAPARHMHQECRTSAGRQEKVRINHLKPCDLVINMLIASMVAMDRSRALLECAAQRQYCAVRTSLLAAHKGPVAGKVKNTSRRPEDHGLDKAFSDRYSTCKALLPLDLAVPVTDPGGC